MNVFSCTQSQRASASVGIDDVLFNTFKTPSIDVQLRWTGEDDQPQRHGVVVAEIRVESSSWDSKLQWRANDADWDKMGG